MVRAHCWTSSLCDDRRATESPGCRVKMSWAWHTLWWLPGQARGEGPGEPLSGDSQGRQSRVSPEPGHCSWPGHPAPGHHRRVRLITAACSDNIMPGLAMENMNSGLFTCDDDSHHTFIPRLTWWRLMMIFMSHCPLWPPCDTDQTRGPGQITFSPFSLDVSSGIRVCGGQWGTMPLKRAVTVCKFDTQQLTHTETRRAEENKNQQGSWHRES